MPHDYDLIEAGDTFNAATLNTRHTAAATAVNTLAVNDIEREALDAQHLPSLWPTFITTAATHGPDTQVAAEVYNNGLPDAVGSGVDYQVFAPASPNAPYGAVSTAHTHADSLGWRIVCYNASVNTTNKAETATSTASLTDEGLRGVLLRGWVEIREGSLTRFDVQELSEANDERRSVLIALGFEDSNGNRYVIERSIRWYSFRACRIGPIGTSTLLTQSDLAAGDGDLQATFLVVASRKRLEFGTDKPQSLGPDIFRYGHTAIPLRAGSL